MKSRSGFIVSHRYAFCTTSSGAKSVVVGHRLAKTRIFKKASVPHMRLMTASCGNQSGVPYFVQRAPAQSQLTGCFLHIGQSSYGLVSANLGERHECRV